MPMKRVFIYGLTRCLLFLSRMQFLNDHMPNANNCRLGILDSKSNFCTEQHWLLCFKFSTIFQKKNQIYDGSFCLVKKMAKCFSNIDSKHRLLEIVSATRSQSIAIAPVLRWALKLSLLCSMGRVLHSSDHQLQQEHRWPRTFSSERLRHPA